MSLLLQLKKVKENLIFVKVKTSETSTLVTLNLIKVHAGNNACREITPNLNFPPCNAKRNEKVLVNTAYIVCLSLSIENEIHMSKSRNNVYVK